MKTLFFATIAAITLSSCAMMKPAPVIYDKPGATQSDFDKDWSYCKYDVTKNTQATDTSYNTIFVQELDRSTRQQKLLALCMQSRGYTPRSK